MNLVRQCVLVAVLAASSLRCSADETLVEEVNPSASDDIRSSMPPCGSVLGSFDGTAAYSNGANTGTGVSCRGGGAYGLQYQCVELVMRHFQTHWGMRWWGNARDLLNNAPRDRVAVYGNGDGAHPPVPGDMVVWQTGQWGHVALVTGVRPGAVDILEQNVGGNGHASLPYDGRTIGSRWGGWRPQGWAHAHANAARPPAPTCPVHCEGNTLVAADCGRSDCGGAQCRGDRCVAPPRGSLDAAQCDEIRGWAQDPTVAASAIDVDVYFDGPAGSGARSVRVRADARREDLCSAVGSCEHAFSLDTPMALRDGREHQVYAYALAADGRAQPALGNSPRSLRCTVARVADFNGDGRSDLVQYRSDRTSLPVCLSLGSGWSCRNLAADAEGWAGGNQGSAVLDGAAPLLGRFNDDALADVIQFRADADRLPVCLSLGSGWSCRGLAAGYGGGVGEGNGGSGLYGGSEPVVGDFNGDRRDDVIQYRDTATSLPVCLSLGSGWSCRNLAATQTGGGGGNEGSGVYRGSTALAGDFDGDGDADLIQYRDDAQTIPVCLSLGSGWSCRDLAASYAGGEGAGNGGSGVYAGSTPLIADFNGDGRSDVIQYRAGAATLPVCLSLASGWSCRNLAVTLPAAGASASAVVMDFDGDGRGDVVQYDPHATTLPVCLSLGTGWSCRDLRADLAGAERTTGNNGSGVFRGGAPLVGDFNGDGRTDLMQYQPQGWELIPVCLNLGSGWSCRALRADYAGGLGAGNAGSGVY